MEEDGLRTIELKIEGMHCESCILAVKSALEHREGVESAEVSLGKALITFQQYQIEQSQIEDEIEASGYLIDRRLQAKTRKGFFERMIESNQKEYGNKRLNCCDL